MVEIEYCVCLTDSTRSLRIYKVYVRSMQPSKKTNQLYWPLLLNGGSRLFPL